MTSMSLAVYTTVVPLKCPVSGPHSTRLSQGGGDHNITDHSTEKSEYNGPKSSINVMVVIRIYWKREKRRRRGRRNRCLQAKEQLVGPHFSIAVSFRDMGNISKIKFGYQVDVSRPKRGLDFFSRWCAKGTTMRPLPLTSLFLNEGCVDFGSEKEIKNDQKSLCVGI